MRVFTGVARKDIRLTGLGNLVMLELNSWTLINPESPKARVSLQSVMT